MKRETIVLLIAVVAMLLSLFALYVLLSERPPESEELRQVIVQLEKARVQTAILKELRAQESIGFFQAFKKYAMLSSLSVLLTSALVIAIATGKRLTTHTVQLEEHVKIPVRHKDLKDSSSHVTAYLAVKQAAALTDNRREAFVMFQQLAQTAAALNRTLPRSESAPALPSQSQAALSVGSIPAFREILNALEPGDKMVLGFEHETNAPITGGFKRIYSCGIFGLSGSGKTTGLYSIIAQSLLLYPAIKYAVIDPHADRPEGLTRGLPKTPHFEHLDALNVRPGLTRFVQELDSRLKSQASYVNAPRVLLIDELPVIMKSAQGQAVEAVLGRIAAEGRKVDMFALISGQDTRLKAAGGNRDLLTSQIAYNLKKKQARYLFDDSEIVDLHKTVREAKEPGLCVFAATDAEPVVMRQPLCTPADVLYVTQLVSNGEPVVRHGTEAAHVDARDVFQVNVEQSVETVETPVETPVERVELDKENAAFLDEIREYKESQQLSLGELSRRAGVDKGLLSKVLHGKESLTPGVKKNLETLLTKGTQQESKPLF